MAQRQISAHAWTPRNRSRAHGHRAPIAAKRIVSFSDRSVLRRAGDCLPWPTGHVLAESRRLKSDSAGAAQAAISSPLLSAQSDRPAAVAQTIARVALQSRGPSGRESRSSRAAPSPRTFGCGRRHERANSEGRTSPDACFLGEQERRARRSSRPPRVSRQRVLPRDCASQGRRPHGPRPARSRLCSRGVRRTASRCCVSSDPVTRPAPALAPAHSGTQKSQFASASTLAARHRVVAESRSGDSSRLSVVHY